MKTQSEITNTKMMIKRPCGAGETTLEITIEGYVEYYTEKGYGEDADGNRGRNILVVDEVKDVVGYDCDEEIALTTKEIEQASQRLAEHFLTK